MRVRRLVYAKGVGDDWVLPSYFGPAATTHPHRPSEFIWQPEPGGEILAHAVAKPHRGRSDVTVANVWLTERLRGTKMPSGKKTSVAFMQRVIAGIRRAYPDATMLNLQVYSDNVPAIKLSGSSLSRRQSLAKESSCSQWSAPSAEQNSIWKKLPLGQKAHVYHAPMSLMRTVHVCAPNAEVATLDIAEWDDLFRLAEDAFCVPGECIWVPDCDDESAVPLAGTVVHLDFSIPDEWYASSFPAAFCARGGAGADDMALAALAKWPLADERVSEFLCEAAGAGCLRTLQTAIADAPPKVLEQCQASGEALNAACRNQQEDAVLALIAAEFDVNAVAHGNSTALSAAIAASRTGATSKSIVEHLLACGADVHAVDECALDACEDIHASEEGDDVCAPEESDGAHAADKRPPADTEGQVLAKILIAAGADIKTVAAKAEAWTQAVMKMEHRMKFFVDACDAERFFCELRSQSCGE